MYNGKKMRSIRSCWSNSRFSWSLFSPGWIMVNPMFHGGRDNSHWGRYFHFNRMLGTTASNGNVKPPDSNVKEETSVNSKVKTESSNVDLKAPGDRQSGATLKIKEAVIKVIPKKTRQKLDVNQKSTDRNFVTALRAMNDYLLKPSDLESLRKIFRRSPYDNKPPMAVYLRKDVETKAIEVWGSQEALQRELRKRQEQDRRNRESIFQVKKVLREFQSQYSAGTETDAKKESIWHGSGRVVLTAVVINASNFTFKLIAWCYTGSHSLFSEAIHSLADTCNQLILAYGIHKSIQKADEYHPYGYTNMRYVASLISGVGIFCFGTGLSLYHGISGLLLQEPIGELYWALFILGGSLVSEGATLIVAMSQLRKSAKEVNMTSTEYVMRSQDPSLNVVLLEDIAAVLGVGIAAICMGLSSYLNNPIPDAIGSCLIGGLLGLVASFIIKTNIAALMGRSIPVNRLTEINQELENDVMIRAIHDAKCIDMGSSLARYKAEIDFDGRELTRSYLDKQDLEAMLEDMQSLKTIDEVEGFMLKHGENVIDLVGAEIDRIESQLKKQHPEIRHCDLEIL